MSDSENYALVLRKCATLLLPEGMTVTVLVHSADLGETGISSTLPSEQLVRGVLADSLGRMLARVAQGPEEASNQADFDVAVLRSYNIASSSSSSS
jgi:hypothetical protein